MNQTVFSSVRVLKPIKIKLIIVILLIILFSSPVIADTISKNGAEIVWMDNPDEVIIRNTTGTMIQSEIGILIDSGFSVKTGHSTVELKIVSNGSVIILDENTTLNIDTIMSVNNDDKISDSVFSILKGKIRFIAAKITGSSYIVRTPTAVAGVRGTDFYRMYEPIMDKDWLCVTEGSVQFDPITGNNGILVPAGSFVNLKNGFQITQPDEEWLRKNLNLNTLHSKIIPKND